MSLKRNLRSSTRNSLPLSTNVPSAPEHLAVAQKSQTKVHRKKSKSPSHKDVDNLRPIDPPSTPPAKRKKTLPPAQVQTTSQGSVIVSETLSDVNSSDVRTPEPPSRPAEPHATNATLKTPGGSRLVPFSKEIVDSSPVKGGLKQPTTTTQQLLEQACAHLVNIDPRMKPLIERHHCRIFSPEGLAEVIDPFESLCSGIISQQVSGAAAKSIKNKFINLFNQNQEGNDIASDRLFPNPSQIVNCDIPLLRSAGLSERKAEYIKGLAEKFHSGELSAKMLLKASDEEVLEKLVMLPFILLNSDDRSLPPDQTAGSRRVAVRGLGRWSVEMFACFALKRMDILSTGDLGVQRGMAAFIGKDVKKLKNKGGKWKYLTEKEMLDISAPFTPYRSVFMWYMWRVEDVDIDAFST